MDYSSDQQNRNCLHLCNKLIELLEKDEEHAEQCFRGEMYRTYVKSTQMAVNKIKKIRRTLQSL